MFNFLYAGLTNNQFSFAAQIVCAGAIFLVPHPLLQLFFAFLLGLLAFCYEKEVEDEIQ